MENKYDGIRQAVPLDKSDAYEPEWENNRQQNGSAILLPAGGAGLGWGAAASGRRKRSHAFLISLLICALFVGAYMLLGLIENPVIDNILDNIYKVLTFDLLGTDPSACFINSWLASIL